MQYPKSLNNQQCISPCYNANTNIIHPTRFINVTLDKPFCATLEHYSEDENGIEVKKIISKCANPTHSHDEIETKSILVPKSGFTKELFLKIYFGVNSVNQCMEWIKMNEYAPLKTKVRMVNAALNAFEENNDILSDMFVDFYIEYLKKSKINDFYAVFNQFITVENDKIYIVDKNKNKLKQNEYKTERINYMVVKFFNKKDIKVFIVRFADLYKDFGKNDDNLEIMTKNLIKYIEKKIEISSSIG